MRPRLSRTLLLCAALAACDLGTPADQARRRWPDAEELSGGVSHDLFYVTSERGELDEAGEVLLEAVGLGLPFGEEREDGSRRVHRHGLWLQAYIPDTLLVVDAEGKRTIMLNDESPWTLPPYCAGEYDEGDRTGEWTFWHPNGQLRARGSFQDDLRHGRWEAWLADGVTVDTSIAGLYERGERVGD